MHLAAKLWLMVFGALGTQEGTAFVSQTHEPVFVTERVFVCDGCAASPSGTGGTVT
jgi:hypothetical protein